jgi:hypothetical protein
MMNNDYFEESMKIGSEINKLGSLLKMLGSGDSAVWVKREILSQQIKESQDLFLTLLHSLYNSGFILDSFEDLKTKIWRLEK